METCRVNDTYDAAKLRHELETDEGRVRSPYRDTEGHLTIGVGWNLDAVPLPDEIIDRLLDISIERAEAALDSIEPRWRKLDQDRQRVLLNLAFNLGPVRFVAFHRFWAAMREFLDTAAQDALQRAAAELVDSRAARQTGQRYVRLADRLRA